MSHHITTLIGTDDAWQAKCSCRWRSPLRTRGEAEAAMDKHTAEVARAQAGLRVRNPSVRTMRDYYRKEAENPENTPEERALWAQLADGLEPRVPVADDEHPRLWD